MRFLFLNALKGNLISTQFGTKHNFNTHRNDRYRYTIYIYTMSLRLIWQIATLTILLDGDPFSPKIFKENHIVY